MNEPLDELKEKGFSMWRRMEKGHKYTLTAGIYHSGLRQDVCVIWDETDNEPVGEWVDEEEARGLIRMVLAGSEGYDSMREVNK